MQAASAVLTLRAPVERFLHEVFCRFIPQNREAAKKPYLTTLFKRSITIKALLQGWTSFRKNSLLLSGCGVGAWLRCGGCIPTSQHSSYLQEAGGGKGTIHTPVRFGYRETGGNSRYADGILQQLIKDFPLMRKKGHYNG